LVLHIQSQSAREAPEIQIQTQHPEKMDQFHDLALFIQTAVAAVDRFPGQELQAHREAVGVETTQEAPVLVGKAIQAEQASQTMLPITLAAQAAVLVL
jgi:hypothetical protein